MAGSLTLVVPAGESHPLAVADLLGDTNHCLRFAADAEAAVDALAGEPFDVVLLDISQPGIDAADILGRLKCDSRVWHIPVIVVGDPDDVEGIARCIGLGAEDYLTQPLHPALLNLRINGFLAKRRLQQLETEYIKIFEEQSAHLHELRRELTDLRSARSTT